MNPRIENVPIDSITVGTRLRKDHGDIAGLAESITDHGLLHPIVIDDDGTLIAGERRLKALQLLDWQEVPVRRWGQLDARQRQVIELEENLQRKDLTDAERSRKLKQLAEVAEQVIAAEVSTESVKTLGGRPPKRSVPENKIAEHIGIPKQTIRDAEKHVAAVDSYPFLAQPGWRQYHAMEAAETLDKLPEEERPAFAALIDQPGIPPRDAIRTLQNVASKPEPERKKIIDLAQSRDERDRSLALTEAAAMPPMPDPRLIPLLEMEREAKRLKRQFPDDPEVPMFDELITCIQRIVASISEGKTHARSVS